ncbi:nucleotidyltransferase domain-containing protein [bacterium]|nr:nucleotidyltransferase domain-containing protein [bacterium]
MSKAPERVEDIFEEFVEDYKSVFKEDLKSVILFGSAARGRYVKGRSDINFVVVLSKEGISRIESAMGLVKKWHKKSVSTPLFFTPEYITMSVDSFPLEFINIKSFYSVIFGEDYFKDIRIETKDLRLQLEHELKGKLLKLRQFYLETKGKKAAIIKLISESVSTFTSIFRGLLYFKGLPIPEDDYEVITKTCDEFTEIETEFFKKLISIKRKEAKPSADEAKSVMEIYIKQISDLVDLVDKME